MIKRIAYNFIDETIEVHTHNGTVTAFNRDKADDLFDFLEMNAIRENIGKREEDMSEDLAAKVAQYVQAGGKITRKKVEISLDDIDDFFDNFFDNMELEDDKD